ncbi:SdpI family protein [Erythrobacter sp. R86502]|uniref:SdpI family protein n=1 Tax=Erythrobacter sp. R86502 TaxID=3093846 RepID=UPI0036D34022
MKVRGLLVANLVIAAAMALFGLWVAAHLPEGAQLPIHWNAAGEADGFASAGTALLLPAGVSVLIGVLFAAVPQMEPLQDRLEASGPLLRSAWIGTILLMVFVQMAIAGPGLDWDLGPDLVLVGLGALLVMIGDSLPKSRPSFLVGIRTPWTLTDTDNWIATHRLGGKMMMIAGCLIVLATLAPISPEGQWIAITALIAIAVVVPVAYSWWLWRTRAG